MNRQVSAILLVLTALALGACATMSATPSAYVANREQPVRGSWSWEAYNAGTAILNVENVAEDGSFAGDYLFTGSGREYPFQSGPNENGRHASGQVVTSDGNVEVKITLFRADISAEAYYELRYDPRRDRLTGEFRVPQYGYHWRSVEFRRTN